MPISGNDLSEEDLIEQQTFVELNLNVSFVRKKTEKDEFLKVLKSYITNGWTDWNIPKKL